MDFSIVSYWRPTYYFFFHTIVIYLVDGKHGDIQLLLSSSTDYQYRFDDHFDSVYLFQHLSKKRFFFHILLTQLYRLSACLHARENKRLHLHGKRFRFIGSVFPVALSYRNHHDERHDLLVYHHGIGVAKFCHEGISP